MIKKGFVLLFLLLYGISPSWAVYTGKKLFSTAINSVTSEVVLSPSRTTVKINLGGSYTTLSCVSYAPGGGLSSWWYHIIWISDPVTENGDQLTLKFPLGQAISLRNMNFSIMATKRLTKNGKVGTVAILGPSREVPDSSEFDYLGQCDDKGRIYPMQLSIEADIGSALPAGKHTLNFLMGYEEHFFTNSNAYGDVAAMNDLLATALIGSISHNVSIPGYCAASTFSPSYLEINHGSLNVTEVNGNEKSASVTYICNTEGLPKVSFIGTTGSAVEVNLCDGVTSNLKQVTTSRGNYGFQTTFTSTLSRNIGSTCSGQFSGSTVASITYD